MEFLNACEDLAANITAFDAATSKNSHISEEDILRWQNLFTLPREEAISAITEWRSCLNPNTITQEAWTTIQEPKTEQGHTKESYEWSISQLASRRPLETQNNTRSLNSHNKMTLLKLDRATFSTASQVQVLANLDRVPLTIPGTDDDEKPVRFCILDSHQNELVTQALSSLTLQQQPTLISVSIAEKNLSRHSVHPFLGIDTTLPHYRPTQEEYRRCLPAQNQFPSGTFSTAPLLTLPHCRESWDTCMTAIATRKRVFVADVLRHGVGSTRHWSMSLLVVLCMVGHIW